MDVHADIHMNAYAHVIARCLYIYIYVNVNVFVYLRMDVCVHAG